MKEFLINLIHYPIHTLGPGERIGVWTQGCSLRCKGCMSTHTWEFDNKYSVDIENLVKAITKTGIKRITISGGEPFDQPERLEKFISLIRNEFSDILVYTGYRYEKIRKDFPNILENIDALIDSPFIEGCETSSIWKGSENQRFFLFNENLFLDYKNWLKKEKKSLQILEKDKEIILIGIPYQKDIKKLKKELIIA